MAKILISSTSLDLTAHRARLMETLRRMEQDGLGMEFFGAAPDSPVSVCHQTVDEADLVVLVLAHRYGWIPPATQGGDGRSSITRLEFERARRGGPAGRPKPVLAFLVDPKADWTSQREQDRLTEATTEAEALEVFRAVRALAEFKIEVQGLVCDFFSTPADLADKAGSAVAKWLLTSRSLQQSGERAQRALKDLMEKVATHLARGDVAVALIYLESAAADADPENRGAIADKRFELASAYLSLHDDRLVSAASAVIEHEGKHRAAARLWLGKCTSQRARDLWRAGQRLEAWSLASDAREQLKHSILLDPLDPDTLGTLGGLLKRTSEWAHWVRPDQVELLEDEMLAAYERGWSRTAHAYPLLNYIEQRARLRAKRRPGEPVVLIEANEPALREALARGLKAREAQLGSRQDRPWAAFDVARGRHYLKPNVPLFLDDLARAVEEARSVAQQASDRFMVTTTRESLACLRSARVELDGLEEAIELLDLAVQDDDWFLAPPARPTQYLERELLALRADLTEALEQQGWQAARADARLAEFVRNTEVRWTREDEEAFQEELVKWKRSLEPRELKIARGLWKVVGPKAMELLTFGIPVDWSAAAELLSRGLR